MGSRDHTQINLEFNRENLQTPQKLTKLLLLAGGTVCENKF